MPSKKKLPEDPFFARYPPGLARDGGIMLISLAAGRHRRRLETVTAFQDV